MAKTIICKDTPEALAEIREAILAGTTVTVVNQYSTVYGVGFDEWLINGTADIATVEVHDEARFQWEYGYPDMYVVTPNKI